MVMRINTAIKDLEKISLIPDDFSCREEFNLTFIFVGGEWYNFRIDWDDGNKTQIALLESVVKLAEKEVEEKEEEKALEDE